MGLQDFWDNITTPGFIETTFKELTDMCKEFTQEMVNLREEGEEVFIDGFHEMVIKENRDYKNSFEKKEEASRLISDIREQVLAARGITGTGTCYLLNVIAKSFRNAVTALINLDQTMVGMVTLNLQEEYEHLPILTPDGIYKFSNQLNELLRLPLPPQYKEPYPKSQSAFLDTSLRKQRVDASNAFLAEANEYLSTMRMELNRQQFAGIAFDETQLTDHVIKVLEKLERRLALENSSLKLLSKKNDLCQDDWLVVRSALLLAAGIHGIVSLALPSQGNSPSMITNDFKIEMIMGLTETASRNETSCLVKYLADIEEINPLKGLRCA
ncbi:MAG: hypothetical protein AB7V51_07855, partial [Methanoregulaceae archaeon]